MGTNTRRARAVRLWAGMVALVVSATVGLAATSAGAAGSNTLTVKAGEYVYQLKGSPKSGWTQIDFDNAGVEDHMMLVLQLKPGITVKQLKAAAVSQDQNAAFQKIAAPNADPNGVMGTPDLIGPGQKTSTITQLPAGHYGILCFVNAPDGKSHAAHGMVKTFEVAKAQSSLKPPTSGVTDVTLSDSSITFPTDNIGRNLSAKVTNSGTTAHSFTLVKVNAGKTLDDVKSYVDAFSNGQAPVGEAPGTIVGGVSSVAPGGTAYLEQTLTAGHYGYVSTQGNAPDDDYSKGLKGEFDVK
jgi:hypothetical protein